MNDGMLTVLLSKFVEEKCVPVAKLIRIFFFFFFLKTIIMSEPADNILNTNQLSLITEGKISY